MYRQMMENITAGIKHHSFSGLDLPDEVLREVSTIVDRIEDWLSAVSYEHLIDQIVRRDKGLGYPAADGNVINVIPGNQKVACTKTTLAMSTGISPVSWLAFPSVMRSVREHLINCERLAKVVIFLTDTWSPRHIEEHIKDIQAHARQGRYVLPHLVTGGRVLRVDWPRV